MQFPVFAVLQVTGHILDSLTLSKIIDKIQVFGCQYQINDIDIGHQKSDFSSAQISVWAETEDDLQHILDELQSYGVRRLEGASSPSSSASEQTGIE